MRSRKWGVMKSTYFDPEIFTISFLPRNSFGIGYYYMFSSSLMPILRAQEAHDEVIDTNITLEGQKRDMGTTKFKCRQPAIR